jgi:hypothetical protein
MGFYLRKSIKVGPLRFNLSKSGVGVSAGVKGLRFGVGPRGNYVHMGRGGLYYRATLPHTPFIQTREKNRLPEKYDPQVPIGTHAPLEEIESEDITKIIDSSSRELLNELNQKRAMVRIWPIVVAGSALVLLFGLWNKWSNVLLTAISIISVIAIYVARSRDIVAKTVVLFYNFDSEMEDIYDKFHGYAEKLASCAAAWHIEAAGKVYDRKYHAGASNLVRRKRTHIRKAEPPYVKTNIETVAIGVGRQTLYFFPERVLVYDTNGVGAVSYSDLHVKIETTKFIESESVPMDAKIVDKTWRYVNKSGGPDRRFKNNTEIPICLYEEISLSSKSGLNELLQLSHCGFGKNFAAGIAMLGSSIPSERRAE